MKDGSPTCLAPGILVTLSFLLIGGPALGDAGLDVSHPGGDLAPLRIEGITGVQGRTFGRFSERTVVLVLGVDSDQGRLVAYTLKDRPFVAPLNPEAPRTSRGHEVAQIEVVLLGPSGLRYTRRIDVPGVCLEHPPDAAPHIQGDTIRVHRDTVLVEVPEIEGFDRIEAAFYTEGQQAPVRSVLVSASLDVAHFTPAGERVRYGDLAFASASTAGPPVTPDTTGDVLWPESFGDPDVYTIYGDPAEVSWRINITIVPDGYTFAEKATMVSHANALVAYLRSKTPYKEHDPFINYILVYAYSDESGTDQCDCGIVRNTAMSTGFPNAGYPCDDGGNRCLYYGYNCDTDTSFHLAQAEARAPASDAKMVMVNTTRYGGCGGQRAVYSAGNAFATDVEAHELGHSLAGLADEYATTTGCGSVAGGINTSTNATAGDWPEWIPDLGPPWQGAQYYTSCIYRPQADCTMRSLGSEFCDVCRQRWALTIFGHSRVASTAPVKFMSPSTPLLVPPGTQKDFSITTRFATGPSVTNSITWRIQGPGFPAPTTVATNTTSYSHTFDALGSYTLTCEVVADTNFIKPSKNGANADVITWKIDAVVDADGDGYLSNVDCNDADPAIHPGATESCNGVDDNCNSAVDEGFDRDRDGFTTCGGDCNDGLASVRPGGVQVCDGLNNDCSFPGWPALTGTNETDDDGDAYSECQGDCNDADPAIHPGATESCNGVDDNCNMAVDDGFDQDGDGVTTCGGDCNDGLASVRPGGVQICDGLNNDCSFPGWPALTGTNEADDDGDAYSECQGDCNDALASVRPGGAQVCDGLNNDCSFPGWPALAGTNEQDDDVDTYSECQGDCDDTLPARYPDAPEINDGMDNQCPGNAGHFLIDEVSGAIAFNDPGDSTQFCWPAQAGATLYEVVRSNSSGFAGGCTGALTGPACWSDSGVPPVGEVFYYLVRAASPHVGSWGGRSSGTERTGLCGAESICTDGLDNDGDTLIDCDDPDCLGQAICAPEIFGFVDTLGDDISTTALVEFFSATTAGPTDYILYSIHSPGPGDFEVCAERADFYQNNYLTLAEPGGSVLSGNWNRWHRTAAGPWVGPVTDPYPNLFGYSCADVYGWCPEGGLGDRVPAILPSLNYECEVADLVLGCGDGTWSLTIKVGKTRIATCSF